MFFHCRQRIVVSKSWKKLATAFHEIMDFGLFNLIINLHKAYLETRNYAFVKI